MARLTLKSLKTGDLVRALNNRYSANGFNKGDVAEVSNSVGSLSVLLETGMVLYITLQDIELARLSKEEIKKSIESLEKEITLQKSKLEWMDVTGAEVYDETEAKVWNTLKTIKSDSSDIEKAKIIANLIRQ